MSTEMPKIESIIKSAYKFRTLDEMLQAYYGPAQEYLGKADAPITTATTGVRNVVYGPQLFAQVCVAYNTFGCLPKDIWRSGFRAISAAGSTASAGTAENAAIPDTVKPTFVQIATPPKLVSASSEETLLELAMEKVDDVALWDDIIAYMKEEFQNRINRGMHTSFDNLAGTNVESIDRVCASSGEQAACGETAADEDLYGIDRSANTWFNAYVAHNSNVDRTMALSQVDALFPQVRPFWKDNSMQNKVIITGYDTLERLEQLIQSQQRFVNTVSAQMSVNGIQTLKGAEAGFDVTAYKYVPCVPDQNAVQDTLSRLELIDLDFTAIQMAVPIMYQESEEYLHIDRFGRMAVYYGAMELVCKKPAGCAKLRDLK